jgi:membrane fusion protein, heavy metal efflux system
VAGGTAPISLRVNMNNNRLRGSRAAAPRFHLARVLTAAMTAAALSLGGCSPKAADGPPAAPGSASAVTLTPAQRQSIRLYTVKAATYRRTIDTSGAVDFDNDQATSVLAPFSGPVTRLLVPLGAHVEAGAALAVVDSPDFATAVGAYRKALSTATTARRLADLDKDLLAHHGVAQREADQAETDAVSAEADRDAARQGLVALKVPGETIKDIEAGRPVPRLEGVIRAPIAGTVAERLISPGQLLEAGTTPCFTVADLSRVWILAQVFGADLASVSVGDSAEVATGVGANTVSGTVDNIAALVDPNTRATAVRVVVRNPGELLKKQMYVRVLLKARRESKGPLVPVSAMLRDDENLPFVYLAQPDGSFARRRVTLGYRTDDQYDIPAGLQAGDQVVVDGGIFVQFMQNQ